MALLYKMRAITVSDSSYVFWTDSSPDLTGANAPQAVVTDSVVVDSIGGAVTAGETNVATPMAATWATTPLPAAAPIYPRIITTDTHIYIFGEQIFSAPRTNPLDITSVGAYSTLGTNFPKYTSASAKIATEAGDCLEHGMNALQISV